MLDLGNVMDIAHIRLNGKDMGFLWRPPFRKDISHALLPGENRLEIQIYNRWVNRLIGDEQLPDDAKWAGQNRHVPLAEWPAWFLEGKDSPTGRIAFTTFKHWLKDDPLLESGLIGPVILRFANEKPLP